MSSMVLNPVSQENMAKFMDKCFNPSNLQFFVYNELTANGYTVLNQDYTKVNFKKCIDSGLF